MGGYPFEDVPEAKPIQERIWLMSMDEDYQKVISERAPKRAQMMVDMFVEQIIIMAMLPVLFEGVSD
jgi:hypothetical protein